MALRLNLARNPALANDALNGWSSTPAGYARSAGTTFGKTSDGASNFLSSTNKTAVSPHTASASGTLNTGHARVWLDSAGSTTVRFVVYADSSGVPGALLAQSDAFTLTQTTEAERVFTFSGVNQIAVTSATTYWLGVSWQDPGSPSVSVSRDNTASARQEVSTYLPDPFGSGSALTGPVDAYVTISTGLPRDTSWSGTGTDVDINTCRAAVTAGQSYVFSFSIRAAATQNGDCLVNFYSAVEGGTFIANSGATVPITTTAGTVQRFTIGPYTAPSGALGAHIKLNNVESLDVTAVRVCKSTGNLTEDGLYFDGDTIGATWDGTAGNSTSTWRIASDAITVTDTASKSVTAAGPTGNELVSFVETVTVLASTTATEGFLVRDGALVASIDHDADRGANIIRAFTFAENVVQVRVSSRIGGVWSVIRGGNIVVLDGVMVRDAEDYEYVSGLLTEYLIEGLTDSGLTVQSAIVSRDSTNDPAWIKFIGAPSFNRRLTLTGWSDISRDSRAALYQVQGRSDPVVVSDVHSSRRVTINCKAETVDEADALDDALSRGYPCYLQVPVTLPLPSLYASIGDYSWQRPAPRSRRGIFSINLTEVAPPPATIAGLFTTWTDILAEHVSWEAFIAAETSWRTALVA